MIRRGLPVVVVMLAVSACSTASPPPATAPLPTPVVSASPSPSPAPAPMVGLDQLKAWVDAAKLRPKVVGASKPVNDLSGTDHAIDVCGKQLPDGERPGYVRYWRWTGTHLGYVEHTVAAYQGGQDVLTDLKDAEHACTAYEQSDAYGRARLTPAGDYPVRGGYGYCVLSTTTAPAKDKGQKAYICTGAVARRGIVATVRVFSGPKEQTLRSAQKNLGGAVAAAEAALAVAVPAVNR